MKLKPSVNHLLIKALPHRELTKGGIVVPEIYNPMTFRAEVLEVGEMTGRKQKYRAPMDLLPGDIVILGRYSGTKFDVDGSEYRIIHYEEILAAEDEGD